MPAARRGSRGGPACPRRAGSSAAARRGRSPARSSGSCGLWRPGRFRQRSSSCRTWVSFRACRDGRARGFVKVGGEPPAGRLRNVPLVYGSWFPGVFAVDERLTNRKGRGRCAHAGSADVGWRDARSGLRVTDAARVRWERGRLVAEAPDDVGRGCWTARGRGGNVGRGRRGRAMCGTGAGRRGEGTRVLDGVMCVGNVGDGWSGRRIVRRGKGGKGDPAPACVRSHAIFSGYASR